MKTLEYGRDESGTRIFCLLIVRRTKNAHRDEPAWRRSEFK